jgi:hypothetical protein
LGGDITSKELLKRLFKLGNKNEILLHIDITETNQENLIRDFLFKFLITKCFFDNNEIFYYGNELKIKIEVANNFEDFLKNILY